MPGLALPHAWPAPPATDGPDELPAQLAGVSLDDTTPTQPAHGPPHVPLQPPSLPAPRPADAADTGSIRSLSLDSSPAPPSASPSTSASTSASASAPPPDSTAPAPGGDAAAPLSIGDALQYPLHTPLVGPDAPHQYSPEDAYDYGYGYGYSGGYGAYDDGSVYIGQYGPLPPGILPGSRRARAIADHDGRESMVSDLDVDTLRLDGASMRSRSSRWSFAATSAAASGKSSGSGSGDGAGMNVPVEGVGRAAPRPGGPGAPSGRQQAPSIATDSQSLYTAVSHISASTSGSGRSRNTRPSKNASKNAGSHLAPTPEEPAKTGPTLAEEYLSKGITYHEQGDMTRSAFYFERSAKIEGGCVVGMCMWGLTLREGWGARKDPKRGFEWIQMAAARAGEMSNSAGAGGAELKAIRSELKLAVYELGKCHCYGWGTKKDPQTALGYFELAARLGDVDAQAEAGALYCAGKGCKKDLKKAAMYYRMAEKQGYDTVGLSWIWKEKYN